MRSDLKARAQGRWRAMLPSLGVSPRFLVNRHGPCPVCGGKDRFRWDDKDGHGTFFCSGACGAGDGFALVMLVNGWDFKEAARQVEQLVGTANVTPIRRDAAPEDIRKALKRMWCASAPSTASDLVGRYLANRGLATPAMGLRTAESIKYQADPSSYHPAMVGVVCGSDGKPVTLHRTYLTADGRKADVPSPKRLMPGNVPKGSAIRLGEAGEALGIAEGIETALAASVLFGLPVWAAIGTTIMAGWTPPEGVREVVIFADHDENYAGQAAAFALAHRIQRADLRVRVTAPDAPGDWNDVLLATGRRVAA